MGRSSWFTARAATHLMMMLTRRRSANDMAAGRRKRLEKLRQDKSIVEALDAWWECAIRSVLTDPAADEVNAVRRLSGKVDPGAEAEDLIPHVPTLPKTAYHSMLHKLQRVLTRTGNQEWDATKASAVAMEDLQRDLQGGELFDKPRFSDALFELTNLLVEADAADEYSAFLWRLLGCVAAPATGYSSTGGSSSSFQWRRVVWLPDESIKLNEDYADLWSALISTDDELMEASKPATRPRRVVEGEHEEEEEDDEDGVEGFAQTPTPQRLRKPMPCCSRAALLKRLAEKGAAYPGYLPIMESDGSFRKQPHAGLTRSKSRSLAPQLTRQASEVTRALRALWGGATSAGPPRIMANNGGGSGSGSKDTTPNTSFSRRQPMASRQNSSEELSSRDSSPKYARAAAAAKVLSREGSRTSVAESSSRSLTRAFTGGFSGSSKKNKKEKKKGKGKDAAAPSTPEPVSPTKVPRDKPWRKSKELKQSAVGEEESLEDLWGTVPDLTPSSLLISDNLVPTMA